MPNMSRAVISLPASESAWRCKRCGHVFAKGLEMCPQCTSISVTEVRMPHTRRGKVEAQEAARQAQTPEQTGEAGDGGPDNPPDGTGDQASSYEGWVKRELQAELEKRGLSKSGNVTDLIDRLVEDDRSKAEAKAAENQVVTIQPDSVKHGQKATEPR